MSNIRNFFRSKRSRQCDLVEVSVKIMPDGTVIGQDKSFIVDSARIAEGKYIIECGENSNAPLFVSHLFAQSGFAAHVESSDDKMIEVHAKDLANAGADADCEINITFQWFKGNRIY